MIKKFTLLIFICFFISASPNVWAYDEWLSDVWGSSANDVFVVGSRHFYNSPTAGNIILHYDGKQWREMDSGIQNSLMAVWGTSPTNVYAVGRGGVLIKYDGKRWATILNDDLLADELGSIWGSSKSNIFVTGSKDGRGFILHYDGTLWTKMYPENHKAHYGAVWGTSASDVFFSARNDNFSSHIECMIMMVVISGEVLLQIFL